ERSAVLRVLSFLLWLGSGALVYGCATVLAWQASVAGETAAEGVAQSTAAHAGFWAVLSISLAPLLHVLGIGLLPDTLLMFFTAALLWLMLRLLQPAALQRRADWLLLGLLLGLAGLSKYTAILFALALGLGLLAAYGRQLLRTPALWGGLLLALLLVAPVLIWNYQNHWISFIYQTRHGAGEAWRASEVLRFAVLQLLAYGPLLLAGLSAWPGRPRRYLLLLFVLPWGLLAFLAGGGVSLPHWSAPAWVALAPLAGVALARAAPRWRMVLRALAGLQALACLALLGLTWSGGLPWLGSTAGHGDRAAPSNPFADVHGWDAAGQRARSLALQHGLSSVSVQNWSLASRLGWYARPLPVHVLEDRFDQFDLWAGDLPRGADTLLLDWSQLAFEPPLGAHGFGDCTRLETQPVQRFGVVIAEFTFYACHGWSAAPQPRLRERP
ncbi:MAG: glycosyltransferase family 39 protein, partial [Rhodoferax sp.]